MPPRVAGRGPYVQAAVCEIDPLAVPQPLVRRPERHVPVALFDRYGGDMGRQLGGAALTQQLDLPGPSPVLQIEALDRVTLLPADPDPAADRLTQRQGLGVGVPVGVGHD